MNNNNTPATVTPIRKPSVSLPDFLDAIFNFKDTQDAGEAVCLTYPSGNKAWFNLTATPETMDGVKDSPISQYFCVSTVDPQVFDGMVRRKRSTVRSAMLFGLDDIGTKAAEPSVEPSYKMETSAGNYQWGYLIKPIILDGQGGENTLYFEACIRAAVTAGLNDKGATGCYRVLRIPNSINIKPENDGFRSRLTEWNPEREWLLSDLMAELGLTPEYEAKKKPTTAATPTGDELHDWLKSRGEALTNSDDWHDIQCPWSAEHTDGETGAYYSPIGCGSDDTRDTRQFKCHHGHCSDRDINDYLAHVATIGAPMLTSVNTPSLEVALAYIEEIKKQASNIAWLAPDTIDILGSIKTLSEPAWLEIRDFIKTAKALSIVEVEKAMAKAKRIATGSDKVLTHRSVAQSLLNDYTRNDGDEPVGCYGALQRYEQGVWVAEERDSTITTISCSKFDGESICKKFSDYKGVADVMYLLKSDATFFTDAPKGVAAGDNFYALGKDSELSIEPITPEHRSRFRLSQEPDDTPTPLFDQFLNDVFTSDDAEYEAQQRAVFQEVFGGVLFGLIAPLQKAVIFHGATRAGKGVAVDVLKALMPDDVTGSVSPFKWDSEYHTASMVGKRLNTCGEFSQHAPLPASPFKMITGGDAVSCRQPMGRVFSAVIDSAHVFSCNYLPYCSEQSAAFYIRWQGVVFNNSCSDSDRNPQLADDIKATELGGVLKWALKGAQRLHKQQRFSPSKAHTEMMQQWRVRADAAAGFVEHLQETIAAGLILPILGKTPPPDKNGDIVYNATSFYQAYEQWSHTEGAGRAMGKKPFNERLESIEGVKRKRTETGRVVLLTLK